MSFVSIFMLLVSFSWLSAWLLQKYRRIQDMINKIQGPTALPLLGNLHQFRLNPDEFFEQAQGVAYLFNEQPVRMARIWLGPLPFLLLYGAEEVKTVLSSNKLLTKLPHYSFLSVWIGEGLLISKPDKWRPRRKLLTPTFHYDILKDFVQVFNRHAKTLVSRFDKLAEAGEFTNVFHTITLCTLDIICEAALGTDINAQKGEHSDYLDAVFKIKYIIHQRMIRPFFYSSILFRLFGEGREQERCVKILHDFTSKAILERKKAVEAAEGVEHLLKQKAEEQGSHAGMRMALLDLMLDMQNKNQLDMEGIQEEVDTFTFEGHDTTSTALNWFLHLMGANPSIQGRVQEELDDLLGPDLDRELTYEEIGKLTYVDACLKETLRLYPSVPLIARQATEDTEICGYMVPAGTGIVIVPSMVHKDPKYWPNPEVFDPERFLHSNNSEGGGQMEQNPYAYIPFSAGSRNCIGQRFAVMEEKCLVANILRRFHVEAELRTDQMRVGAELIIRPLKGNFLRFHRRQFGEYCCPERFRSTPFTTITNENNEKNPDEEKRSSSRAQA